MAFGDMVRISIPRWAFILLAKWVLVTPLRYKRPRASLVFRTGTRPRGKLRGG
jgi:hypothetical protein